MEEPLEQTISARQLGAAFSGCFLGAGYVSGREMWQFFGRFGPVGWLGLCLSIALLGGAGLLLLTMVRRTGRHELSFLMVPWQCPALRHLPGSFLCPAPVRGGNHHDSGDGGGASSGLWTAPLAMRIALCSVDRSPLSVGAAGDDLYLFLCGPRAGSLYGGVRGGGPAPAACLSAACVPGRCWVASLRYGIFGL